MRTLRELAANESGATLIEYALIVSLIAIVIVSIGLTFGAGLDGVYRRIALTLSSA